MNRNIYLDYAAATPIDGSVLKAMEPYFTKQFYNPSATYLAGRSVRRALEQARSLVAQWLGARPAEIIFTAGATEANNLAIQGVMSQHPKGEMLLSSIEHESVIAPAGLFKNKKIPVSSEGIIDIKELEKMISNETVLVSLMLVNNELGTIQPLRKVAVILENIRKKRRRNGNTLPLLLHTDAAQAANYFDLHISRLGVNLMTINGGKVYGPKQAGILYVRSGVSLQPLMLGGGQERHLRSGTENIASAVGLAAALNIAQKHKEAELQRVHLLRSLFIQEVQKSIPTALVNGSKKNQSPHIAHITFPGYDNERLMMELDEAGVQCAVGSACSASKQEPSHVLTAIGLDEELARSSLRFSFGRPTTKHDIRQTVRLLQQLIDSYTVK